jgi:hypothetical protein
MVSKVDHTHMNQWRTLVLRGSLNPQAIPQIDSSASTASSAKASRTYKFPSPSRVGAERKLGSCAQPPIVTSDVFLALRGRCSTYRRNPAEPARIRRARNRVDVDRNPHHRPRRGGVAGLIPIRRSGTVSVTPAAPGKLRR